MKRTTFAAIAALSSVSLVGSVGCEGGQGTGARALPVSSQASVEDTPVAVAGADAGGAGAASAVCGVTLVATLVFHGSQTLDGTASLAQPIPFAIPASIPVTTGGTKNGSAQLQFSAGGGAPVTCSYELHGGGQSFPLSGCDNGASAGGLESADSFMLHIRTADHGAGTSGTEIQLTAVLDAPDGTVCRGSDECFQAYACQSGTCTGSNPVTCTASDQCHTAGTCDPSSGTCSNPSRTGRHGVQRREPLRPRRGLRGRCLHRGRSRHMSGARPMPLDRHLRFVDRPVQQSHRARRHRVQRRKPLHRQ